MADAVYVREGNESRLTVAASVGVGELWQLSSGEAGFYTRTATGLAQAASSGDQVDFRTTGKVTVTKTTGVALLDGGRGYWDHSANSLTFEKVNDRDFYGGRIVGDWTTTDATCVIDLNKDPRYDIDLLRDPYLSVLVGTPAASAFAYPVLLGGSLVFEMSATNEAQKVDALSVDGFAKGANAIIEGVFRVNSDGAGTNTDVSMGIANGTHASDFDSVAESVLIHLNGNSTTIYAESDDGTVEVAATDTTIVYVEGSAVANRVEFWMDMRNPADVQIYLNGVLALGSTVFNVDASTGPWFLVCHVEKASSADVYKLTLDALRARFSEQ